MSHTCSFVSFLFLNVSQVFADMVFIVWLMMFDVFDLRMAGDKGCRILGHRNDGKPQVPQKVGDP